MDSPIEGDFGRMLMMARNYYDKEQYEFARCSLLGAESFADRNGINPHIYPLYEDMSERIRIRGKVKDLINRTSIELESLSEY